MSDQEDIPSNAGDVPQDNEDGADPENIQEDQNPENLDEKPDGEENNKDEKLDEEAKNPDEENEDANKEPPINIPLETNKMIQLLKEGLSQISRTADNAGYAFVVLNAASKEIENLYTSLNQYPHIRYLNISDNKIKDLSGVTSLNYLLKLDASKNEVQELNFLAVKNTLPYLQEIDLSNNKIKKLTPIESPRLLRLNLTENALTTCEEFQGHPSLKQIKLKKNSLINLKGIANLPNLEVIKAKDNQINTISDLCNLQNLVKLNLKINKLEKFENLPQMPALEKFYFDNNLIPDVKMLVVLKEFPNLTTLSCDGNPYGEGADYKRETLIVLQHLKYIGKDLIEESELTEAREELQRRINEEIEKKQEAERLKFEEEEAEKQKLLEAEEAEKQKLLEAEQLKQVEGNEKNTEEKAHDSNEEE